MRSPVLCRAAQEQLEISKDYGLLLCFPAHDALGMCRTRPVSPEQPTARKCSCVRTVYHTILICVLLHITKCDTLPPRSINQKLNLLRVNVELLTVSSKDYGCERTLVLVIMLSCACDHGQLLMCL